MNIDITTILINAVVTIFTTAIVIRLSLNQGRLEITNKFKKNAQKTLIKYGQILLFGFLILSISYQIYMFAIDTKPITRVAIIAVSGNVVLFLLWLCMVVIIISTKKKKKPLTSH